MLDLRIVRLVSSERGLARAVFATMAEVFDEGAGELTDAYLDRLLLRPDFWALGAVVGDEVIGGITAHALPMTRSEAVELFIYDIAVRAEHQRKGVGRRLVEALRRAAEGEGIEQAFVPADNDDTHALDFYKALGGAPAAVTIFSFPGPSAEHPDSAPPRALGSEKLASGVARSVGGNE